MEHEITDTSTKSAKSTLTKIVKFNTAICATFAAIWALTALLHQHASPWSGLSGVGFMLGLLVTISALNARLRVELEEPDSAE
jgi:multisubunit Na+/H+ antiporter MnhB subunit